MILLIFAYAFALLLEAGGLVVPATVALTLSLMTSLYKQPNKVLGLIVLVGIVRDLFLVTRLGTTSGVLLVAYGLVVLVLSKFDINRYVLVLVWSLAVGLVLTLLQLGRLDVAVVLVFSGVTILTHIGLSRRLESTMEVKIKY